jgi:hypothetical protein
MSAVSIYSRPICCQYKHVNVNLALNSLLAGNCMGNSLRNPRREELIARSLHTHRAPHVHQISSSRAQCVKQIDF